MPESDDPAAHREARRQAAREKVAAMSPDQRAARRQALAPQTSQRSTMRRSTLPTSLADPVRDLTGSFDLVYPVHSVNDHMNGADNDWINVTEQGFPHGLRAGGWVYLKSVGRVGARCRVKRVEYRENLREHTPGGDGIHAPITQAAVLVLHADTWETVDFPAHERHQQGYRYARTDDEAGTVTHLIGGHDDVTYALRPSAP